MRNTTACALLLSAVFFSSSCNKGTELTPREQQELDEETAVLLPNEIIEQEGIRFILNYAQENAQIALTLNRGTGVTLIPMRMDQEQPYVNYSVLTDSLPENTEFTIQADFVSVTNPAVFDITVIGFTNFNTSKSFTVSGLSFTKANQGSKRSILRVKKGLKKYAFYSVQ